MRTLVAYLTSAFVHVAALVGLAFYMPADWCPRLEVDSGITIVASFSMAAALAEPEAAVVIEEVEAEPLPQEEVTPVEADLEFSPAATKLARRENDAPEVIAMQAVVAERDETPPPRTAVKQQTVNQETPPPPDMPPPKAKRQQKTALDVARHSIAMPQMTAVAAGANVERLPRQYRSNRPPVYPPEEVAAGVTGLVHVRCLIAASGHVDSATVERTSGSARLDGAALDAVRTWQFEPAQRAGIAVAFEVIVPVRFSIR